MSKNTNSNDLENKKNKNEKDNESHINKNKKSFISISDFPENNIKISHNIIQTSIIKNPINKFEKIKSVDANNYLNNENNPITSFNDIKLSILNKNQNFNTPFLFSKNTIDLSNPEKIEEEKNYQMKRYRYLKSYKYSFHPSIRREKTTIIQKWWKQKINPKIVKRKKAIKIQSAFRGYIMRKHLNDIICISVIYQNFINKMRKVLTNFVRRNYFPKRYYKKKYALEKLLPLKIKVFFRKWKNYKINSEQREKAVGNMIKKREKSRYVLLVLKSFFNIWKLKCEEMKQNEKGENLLNNKDKRYYAISKLFNKLERIGNKNAFSLSKNSLRKYLKYIFQKKYAMKILKFYRKYNSERNIKKYFDKWRYNIFKEKERNLKIKILTNEIKTHTRLNDKENLRNNFNNLRAKTNLQNIKDLKRAKKEFLFPQGIKHITKCIRKNIFRKIFTKIIRKIKIEKKLSKIIGNTMKKFYLNKWRNILKKEKHEEMKKNKIKKLILIISHLNNNNILSKNLYKWKSNTTVEKSGKNIINIYSKLCQELFHYVNIKNKPNKKYFINKFKKHINPKSNIIHKKLLKLINNYSNKSRKLRIESSIKKWKKYVQYQKLNDLKAKNLETVARLSKAVYNSKKLSKNLYQWKEKNNLMKLINKNIFKDNVNNLNDFLMRIKNRRMKLFFDNLKKAKSNLLKKIIIKNIANKYMKKILNNKFNKWKLISIKQKNKYQLDNIDKINKLKNVVNKAIKNQEKSFYGSLKKAINKWYLTSKLIDKENYNQFLKNIKKAFGIIKTICIRFSLKEPFNKIKLSEVNYKNVILNRIKKYFIKNDENNLRDAFIRYLTKAKNISNIILKVNILLNLRQKYSQIRNKIYLTKYFNKWKLLNNFLTKEKILAAKNIVNILNNIPKKKILKYSFDKLKYKRRQHYLNNCVRKLFELYTLTEKRCLYHNLQRWKNNSKKISLNLAQRQKGYEMIYKTLSKAFAHKKLFEVLSSLMSQHLNSYYKYFLYKYKLLFQSRIICNYKSQIQNSKIPKPIHFTFKKNIKSNLPLNNKEDNAEMTNNAIINKIRPSKNKINNKSKYNQYKKEENKNIIISINNAKNNFYCERLIPYLLLYLNQLRLRRLKIGFEYLYYIHKRHTFCKLLNSYIRTKNLSEKKIFIKSLKYHLFGQKLLECMRKSGIKKLTSIYLVITKRRNDLFILVHLTKVFKKINKLKQAARFFNLWRLYIRLLKERAAQLEIMEKSFSQTYEKLSDDIFLDIGDEKSVQTQMITFVDKVNYGGVPRKKSAIFHSLDSLNIFFPEKISDDNISEDNKEEININSKKKLGNSNNENDNDFSKSKGNKIKTSLFNKK